MFTYVVPGTGLDSEYTEYSTESAMTYRPIDQIIKQINILNIFVLSPF